MGAMLTQQISDYISGLEPWQYSVSGGFTLRGYYTPPTGKPVVHFLHGNGFNGLVYEKFLAPLSEHYDLFLSHAQGHGDSDSGGDFENWDESAHYFTEVWQQYSGLWNNVEKIGIGHSFGAVNTLLMSGNDETLFDHIVLLDPIIGSRFWTLMANGLSTVGLSKYLPMVRQALARGTEWPDYDALHRYFHQRGIFKGWDDDCLASYLNHGIKLSAEGVYLLKCPPRIESQIFSSYTSKLWSSLAALRIPAHVLFGSDTYDFVRSNLPALEGTYPTVQSYEVTGGHCFMLEHPEDTAEQVLGLLLEGS